MKTIIYFFLIGLQSLSLCSQTPIGNTITGNSQLNQFGWAVDISADGTRFVCSAQGFDSSKGQIKTYSIIDNIVQQIGNTIVGNEIDDFFGSSVAISADGNSIASGAIGGNNYTGYVHIFNLVNDEWRPQGNALQGDNISDEFGDAISLSENGDILAVGAIGQNNYRGSVTVFRLNNNNNIWQQIGSQIIGDAVDDYLGDSAALSDDGTTLIVGIPGKNSLTGAVRVFRTVNDNWIQIGTDIIGTSAGDEFGFFSNISGDGSTIVAAAPLKNANTGEVKVYENSNDNWVQKGSTLVGQSTNSIFGSAVSLSEDGNILLVGAGGNDNMRGQASVFKYNGSDWVPLGTAINGDNQDDLFGLSATISNDGLTILVGAPQQDFEGYVKPYSLNSQLSIEEFDKNKFVIFPNPASNTITISIDNDNKLKTIKIYNGLGQLILSTKDLTIDVSSLAKGIYYLDAQTVYGHTKEKIIIN